MESNVEKLFRTSFIGNIAIVEKEMGSLWGHGKPVATLSASERIWRDVWDRVRTQILDHSNELLRKVSK